MKIKIIFLIPSFTSGGAEHVFVNLLKTIDRNKFQPIVVVGKLTGELVKELPQNIETHTLNETRAVLTTHKLLRCIYQIKPDIVLATLGFVISASICSLFTSKKICYISRFGNTVNAHLQDIKRNSLKKYYLQKWANMFACKKSDHIIAQSRYMLNDIIMTLNADKNKIKIIHNPIMPTKMNGKHSATNNTHNIHLLTVGRLDWQKGYDILIDAMKVIVKHRPQTKLIIVGTGQLQKELNNQVKTNALENNVLFLGYQEHPFKLDITPTMYVSPSRYEGFSNAILEAFANGLPVVATDCPSGIREILVDGRNGWLSNMDGDIASNLAERILYGLDHLHLLNMKDEQQFILDKFNIKTITSQYEALFEQALKQKIS